jgi:Na+/H+-dicarboxylate symporter
MDVMTALVVSFTFGLCIAYLKTVTLEKLFIDVQKVVIKCIEAVILPLLPFYIFGIFLDMTSSGQVASILIVFMKIIVVIFILHVFLLLFQYIVAGAFVKKNPFKLLANMLPAYFTALGTSSSAATIPVTLKSTVKNGVSDGIAGFVVPFCATVHLSGSALKITACALAIMIMEGHAYDFSLFAEFICMLGVIMIAAPGVPGGAIMACVGILGSILGFGNNEQALMIALYITMDNFGTACNVTGDGAIAVVMNKYFKTKPKEAVA